MECARSPAGTALPHIGTAPQSTNRRPRARHLLLSAQSYIGSRAEECPHSMPRRHTHVVCADIDRRQMQVLSGGTRGHILATLSSRKARKNGGLAVVRASDELKCPDASRTSGSDYDGETVVVTGDEQIVRASVNRSEIHHSSTPWGQRYCARQCFGGQGTAAGSSCAYDASGCLHKRSV